MIGTHEDVGNSNVNNVQNNHCHTVEYTYVYT